MTLTQTKPDLEAVARRLGALVPPEAVRHGWNLRDVGYAIDDLGLRWTVDTVGPVEVEIMERETFGGPLFGLLMVHTGSHGTLRARTADELVRLAGEWIDTVWGKPKDHR